MYLIDPKDIYKRNRVNHCRSVEQFLLTYYRHIEREDDIYSLLEAYNRTFKEDGYIVITHHTSTTGKTVSYYGYGNED